LGYSLGVDLGTTFTAAAVCRSTSAEVIFLGDRAPQVPSVVYRPPAGPLLLGEAAERHALVEPERIAREFKRRIGDGTDIYLGGAPMTPVSLSRALLNWTLDRVIPGEGELPDFLTVSCPANWHEFRRELMDQVLAVNADVQATLCTEPEAAAMHLVGSGRVPIGEYIAVYDLGGGTFDGCVLRRTGRAEFELGASEGIEHCGGADFDGALLHRVRAEAGLDAQDPDDEDPAVIAEFERLRRDCVEAKEALSVETAVDIAVTVEARSRKIRITRPEFNELIRPRIDDTADCLARALRRVGVEPADLGAVMLVGGSSRIPLVSEVLTERLGRPVSVSSQPKLCVAMGAALLAASRAQAAAPLPALDRTPSRAVPHPTPIPVPGPAPTAPPRPVAAAPLDDVQDDDEVRRRMPAAAAIASRPRLHLSWHRIASLALVSVALLVMLLPVTKTKDAALTAVLDVENQVAQPVTALPPGANVELDLLGGSWLWRQPLTVNKGGVLPVKPWQLVLGGTVRADVTTKKGPVGELTLRADDWTRWRLLTIPGFAVVLGALFSFAYGESLLRGVRRQRRLPSGGEAIGVIGAGAVAGLAVATIPWLLGSHPLSIAFALTVAASICAAVGLLAFGWDHD
jgi:molecular chaperone DnaK